MTRDALAGWRLDELGGPTADVICPHGFAVDRLNRYDYALNRDQQTGRVSLDDLADWIDERGPDELAAACASAHRPGEGGSGK